MVDGKAIDNQTGLPVENIKPPEPTAISAPDYTVLDIEPYPGSKPTAEKFQLLGVETADGLQFNATWKSPDSIKDIVAHFRGQIKIESQQDLGEGVSLLGKTSRLFQARIFIHRIKTESQTTISVSVNQPKSGGA